MSIRYEVASIGIDQFIKLQNCNLTDCELDARNVQAAFKPQCDAAFLLPGSDATEANCKDFLKSVKGGKSWPENLRLLLSLSTHGTHIPSKTEADGYDEATVCRDFDGQRGYILDDWWFEFFQGIPASSRVYFLADTCMSMGLLRDLIQIRYVQNPLCPIKAPKRRKSRGLLSLFKTSVVDADDSLPAILFPGCEEAGTSASTGKGGALTNAFLAARAEMPPPYSNRELMERTVAKIKAGGYRQRPKLQCATRFVEESFDMPADIAIKEA